MESITLVFRQTPCIRRAKLRTTAFAFDDPRHEMFAIIIEHIIALPLARAGAGHERAAIDRRAMRDNHRAAAMTEGLEIRFKRAAKTARRMNDGAVTRTNTVMFYPAKDTYHDNRACGVNGMSSFKGKWAHETNIGINTQK